MRLMTCTAILVALLLPASIGWAAEADEAGDADRVWMPAGLPVAAPVAAFAQDEPAKDEPAPNPPAQDSPASGNARGYLSVHVGAVVPHVVGDPSTAAAAKLGVGHQFWKSLSGVFTVAYLQPPYENRLSDPRVGDGSAVTNTTQQEVDFTAGAQWHFKPAEARLNWYGGLGARVQLLSIVTNGSSDGQPFLENRGRSIQYGGALMGGGLYRLGPGSVVLELDVGAGPSPSKITGDPFVVSVLVSAGYRVMLW